MIPFKQFKILQTIFVKSLSSLSINSILHASVMNVIEGLNASSCFLSVEVALFSHTRGFWVKYALSTLYCFAGTQKLSCIMYP